MRFIFYIIIIAGLNGCGKPYNQKEGKKFASASAYNNYIIERQKWVANYITTFYEILNDDVDSASAMLAKGLTRIDELTHEIKEMPSYKGDTAFRQAAINSFGFYRRLFEIEYPAIVNLHSKKEGIGFVEQQEEAKILNRIIKDEDKFDKQLHNKQRDFAETNHMLLTTKEKEKD
jgi:hypothetical protein